MRPMPASPPPSKDRSPAPSTPNPAANREQLPIRHDPPSSPPMPVPVATGSVPSPALAMHLRMASLRADLRATASVARSVRR